MMRSTHTWLAAALVVAALTLSGVFIAGVEGGAEPPAANALRVESPARLPNTVRFAGSGSNVLLTRRLAEAFRKRPEGQGIAVVVHDSIGTSGGVRAARDGAVEFGLASRPLGPRELRQELHVRVYARVAVVLAANSSVREKTLTRGEFLDIFRGVRSRWPDRANELNEAKGMPVVVVQRESGDSGYRAIAAGLPAFAEVSRAAWERRAFRVVYSDRAMEAALLSTRGAVGIADQGAIAVQGLPLRVLAIDGVMPTRDTVRDGSYPFVKELSLVWRGEPSAAMSAFMRYLASPEGRQVIEESGYLAVGTP